MTLIDPKGLCPPSFCGEWGPNHSNPWRGETAHTQAQLAFLLSLSNDELTQQEAAYLQSNCIGCVTFSGTAFGKNVSQTFSGWDAYSNWRTGLVLRDKIGRYFNNL